MYNEQTTSSSNEKKIVHHVIIGIAYLLSLLLPYFAINQMANTGGPCNAGIFILIGFPLLIIYAILMLIASLFFMINYGSNKSFYVPITLSSMAIIPSVLLTLFLGTGENYLIFFLVAGTLAYSLLILVKSIIHKKTHYGKAN